MLVMLLVLSLIALPVVMAPARGDTIPLVQTSLVESFIGLGFATWLICRVICPFFSDPCGWEQGPPSLPSWSVAVAGLWPSLQAALLLWAAFWGLWLRRCREVLVSIVTILTIMTTVAVALNAHDRAAAVAQWLP